MPDPVLEIRGAGGFRSSRPLDGRGAVSKKRFFGPSGLGFGLKIMGGPGPRAPPLVPPLNKTKGLTTHPLSSKAVHSLAARSLGVTQQIRKFCSQGEMDH